MVIGVGSRRQLFMDSCFVESSEGVQLTVNEAWKHGKPILVADKPWENATPGGYFQTTGANVTVSAQPR